MIEIKCPKNNISVNERIKDLFEMIENYIDSDEFKKLVLLFGGSDYSNKSLKHKINYLSEFVKIWDYRHSNERWAIKNNDFINENKDLIKELLVKLNLVYSRELENKPDYILVLGGARLSNFERPRKAKKIFNLINENAIVVGLTCDRKISEVEYECYKEYNGLIKTEEDALSKGIEINFNVIIQSTKDNLIKYNDKIYLISARSNEDGKRANSYDTFKEFINTFNIKDKNILLVTNQPYTSYQLLKFIDFAFDNNLFIEAIGCDNDSHLQESNYLQELKSNIDAIKILSDKYLEE